MREKDTGIAGKYRQPTFQDGRLNGNKQLRSMTDSKDEYTYVVARRSRGNFKRTKSTATTSTADTAVTTTTPAESIL